MQSLVFLAFGYRLESRHLFSAVILRALEFLCDEAFRDVPICVVIIGFLLAYRVYICHLEACQEMCDSYFVGSGRDLRVCIHTLGHSRLF